MHSIGEHSEICMTGLEVSSGRPLDGGAQIEERSEALMPARERLGSTARLLSIRSAN